MASEAARAFAQGVGWAGLPGDALAWAVADTFPDRSVLVVCDEPDAARRLVRGLSFFYEDPTRVELFPADDVKPYDGFSPDPELPGQRARVLQRLARGDVIAVVAPVRALLQRIPDRASRQASVVELTVGATLERDELLRRLTETGYLSVAAVTQPGCFAARGDVVDVWPVASKTPRRIDFFDDEIERLRQIQAGTGRTVRKLQRVVLLPAREERLDEASIDRLQTELTRHVAAQGRGVGTRRRIVEELRAGIRYSGLEDLLPALHPTEGPLEAMAGLPVLAVHPSSIAASARELIANARRRWLDLDEEERPLVPPEERFVDVPTLLEQLAAAHPVLEMGGSERSRNLGFEPVEGYAVRGADLAPVLHRLRKLAEGERRAALVARDARSADMLEQLLEPHGVGLIGRASWRDLRPGELSLLVGDLPRGFVGPHVGLSVLPTSALFGARDSDAQHRAHVLFDSAVGSLSDVKEDDLVVHRLHGVGRYRGLLRIDVPGGGKQDFVRIEYRDGDLLYLPATSLGELSRFSALSDTSDVKLDRLGGATWARRKADVRDALLEKAQEMLSLQAKRKLALRPAFPEPGPLYASMVARFPYTETPDQARAILDVHDDLSGDTPMDRLVCGDVGFGKTEVAMRAAMRVVEGGAQVAVLCPTTVLAFQHVLSFRERFEGLPVRIEMLSRFSTPAEVKATLAGLADGSVDVVVGTHRLLGRDVSFKHLGLAVVDEEHRFGVTHKEKLKKLRTEVDVLVMSATPIPRTLQLALAGARDMSIMATPPEERLEVRTMVARFTRTRVRDAILLELERGGQVYFVHNRIESIQAVAEKLTEWVPEARLRVAHGQMEGEQLERILLDFMERRFDLLVCTAIVESGVDLPNVNTMLIDRADQFGLSQLYQLRGRVGRSNVRGNCLLLTPEETTRDARKRLQVLVENTRLGSGFAVAAADLEMRGGGNLLGDSQSGHIDAVGFDTWVELLEEAVHAARGRVDREHIDPAIQLPVPAYIPETLVPDVGRRLKWYQRLSDAHRGKDIEDAVAELESEVGELPAETHNLAGIAEIRLVCREIGVTRCDWLKVRVVLELHPAATISEAQLAALVAENPKRFAVGTTANGARTLAARFTPTEAERPVRFVRWMMARMQQKVRGEAAKGKG